MGFMRRSKKVVVVSHYLLISAHQKECQIISITRNQRMKLKHLFHVMQIDKLVHHSIRIASNVAERGIFRGRLVEVVNGHYRKKLIEGPVVRNRAKHGKIRQILCTQEPPKIVEFL